MADLKQNKLEVIEEKVLGKNDIESGGDSVGAGQHDDFPEHSKADRLLTTKIDIKVLPILGLLFMICFLDRTNIANARLAGLEASLHMPKTGYNTSLWIFYIPFVLAEVPSNAIMGLSRIKPNLWLGGQTLLLGILSVCQGLTKTYHGLLTTRFLMGIVEAGIPAGATFLIASYYRKKELSFRFAFFLSFGLLGTCFSGLLAYAIEGLDGVAGHEGWSWIFILEGIITIFFSILAFIFIPHFPAQDKWINESDRAHLLARLAEDRGRERKSNKSWMKIATDYKIWLMTLLFICTDTSASSLASFNPTILSQLGWTNRRAQVMTIPVWIVGIVGGMLTTLIGGKINRRWPFALSAICCSTVGWVIHLRQIQPASVRYFAQFLISFGTFTTMPLYIGLMTANLRSKESRSFGTAIQFGLGNCANFISSNVFITTQAPRYPVGFATGLGMTVLSFFLMLLVMALFTVHNRNIDAKIAALAPGEELDDQVDYKYVI